jgi:hypothetical protein
MKAKVAITVADGTVDQVTIAVPDFIRWEKTYKTRTSELSSSWRMEDWTFLAWAALKRTGEVDAKFDDWVQDVLEVALLEDDAPRPT